MKISELIEELEFQRDEIGKDAEVEIMFTNEFLRPESAKDCYGTEVIESIDEVTTISSNNTVLIKTYHDEGYIEGELCEYINESIKCENLP